MYFLSNCYSCSNKKIPIFSSQLEKSREAVDAANIRAAYAECETEVLTNGTAAYKAVEPTQTTGGWLIDAKNVAGKDISGVSVVKGTTVYVSAAADGTWEVVTTKPTTGTEIK